MSTVKYVQPLPITAEQAVPLSESPAPAEPPPPGYVGDRYALIFWFCCAGIIVWLLLSDMVRSLFRM